MRRLTSFNRSDRIYSIYGSTIAASIAAILLYNKNRFIDFKFQKQDSINLLNEFYLPHRIYSKIFPNLSKPTPIKYVFVSENLILPVQNRIKKFKNNLSRCFQHDSIKKFFNLISKKKKINNNFFHEVLYSYFSQEFAKIIESIFYVYRIYNFKMLKFNDAVTILNDFFSPNIQMPHKDLKIPSCKFLKNYKLKELIITDTPQILKSYSIINIELKEISLNINPKSVNQYWPDVIFFNLKETKALFSNRKIKIFYGDHEKVIDFLKNFNPDLKDQNLIEKISTKRYSAVESNEKSYIGKYSFFPFNPYSLVDSAIKLLKLED